MQSGEADCGLFAIAFVNALWNGLHPGAYYFDQSLMRSHLLNCFERGEMFNYKREAVQEQDHKGRRIQCILQL